MNERDRFTARAIYLLDTVVKFFDSGENDDARGMSVEYDGTKCDGSCLRDDCHDAAMMLRKYCGFTKTA